MFKFDKDIDYNFSERSKEEINDLRLKEKYLKFHYEKLSNLDNYKMPKENEFDFLITKMSFNAFTFIPFILKNEKIESVLFSTYNIAKRVILCINELLESNQIKDAVIIANKFMKYDHKDIIDLLELTKQKQNFNYYLIHNHSKINCIKTENNYYIISGSGNFSNTDSVEQYSIINNKEIYNKTIKYFKKYNNG